MLEALAIRDLLDHGAVLTRTDMDSTFGISDSFPFASPLGRSLTSPSAGLVQDRTTAGTITRTHQRTFTLKKTAVIRRKSRKETA